MAKSIFHLDQGRARFSSQDDWKKYSFMNFIPLIYPKKTHVTLVTKIKTKLYQYKKINYKDGIKSYYLFGFLFF